MIRTVDELFDSGWASFHDVMFEVLGRSLSVDELKEVFNTLPDHVQFTAFEWGLGDTVFRDAAYVELLRRKK